MGIKMEKKIWNVPLTDGIYFSMPVRWRKRFEVETVDSAEPDILEKIENNVKELLKERKDAFEL